MTDLKHDLIKDAKIVYPDVKVAAKKRRVIFFAIIGVLLMCITAIAALAIGDSETTSNNGWFMGGRNLHRTGWDGVAVGSNGQDTTFVDMPIAYASSPATPIVDNGLLYVNTYRGFTRMDASNISTVVDSWYSSSGSVYDGPIIFKNNIYVQDTAFLYKFSLGDISTPIDTGSITQYYGYGGCSTPFGSSVLAYSTDVYASGIGCYWTVPPDPQGFTRQSLITGFAYDNLAFKNYYMPAGSVNMYGSSALANFGLSNTFLYTDFGNTLYQVSWGAYTLEASIPIGYPKSIAVSNSAVFVGSYNGMDGNVFYKLNALNVSQILTNRTLSTWQGGRISAAAFDGPYVYVGVYESFDSGNPSPGLLYQLNASDLSIVHTFGGQFGVNDGFGSPTIADGIVYVTWYNASNGPTMVYELHASDVSIPIRSYALGDSTFTRDVALSNNYVYVLYNSTAYMQKLRIAEPAICHENWVAHYSPTKCINGTWFKYYLDGNGCTNDPFLVSVPVDNGTSIQCQGPTNGGGTFPGSQPDVTPPPSNVIPIDVVAPPLQQTINFKGMFEAITILMQKIFAGENIKVALNTVLTSYWLELLITIVALVLMILAGLSFKKKNKRGRKK